MKISEQLFQMGISFRRGEDFLPFPIDDASPSIPAAKYFLDKVTLGRIFLAWKQWKGFVSKVMSETAGRNFVSQFFPKETESFVAEYPAPGTDGWNDRQRSELDSFTPEDYFFGPHVTRVDFALNHHNQLVIIDPNVMPYGITPMVATQEILGIKTQEEYLKQLRAFDPTWVADRYHGAAHGLKWLTDHVGAKFSFSDEFMEADNVVRLSRKCIRGRKATIGAPGIRIFESQIWNALMNISGIPEFFGFNADLGLHRANCAPCFLIRLGNESLDVAYSFTRGNGNIQWMKFEDFAGTQWVCNDQKIFLKCLSTSGSRQVTFSDFKKKKVIKAINAKLGMSGYFLLQPALPCLVGGERVRVASYLGPNKEHYGSEVLRVLPENRLAHGGSHAKVSYLVL